MEWTQNWKFCMFSQRQVNKDIPGNVHTSELYVRGG